MAGAGHAIVCCVGPRTIYQKENPAFDMKEATNQTPLEIKLDNLGKVIGRYAEWGAAIILLFLTIFWVFYVLFGSGIALVSADALQQFMGNLQIGVAILIVSVPEGLPLAVSMAMAFSIGKLQESQLLVKDTEALELAGSVMEIFTGKTSTLTKGDMSVRSIYIAGKTYDLTKEQCEIAQTESISKKITDSILINNDAKMEMDDTDYKYKPDGNPCEVGMLKYLGKTQNVQELLA